MSIHLRKKKLADGRDSLYLDIYHHGKRRYEFLKIYLDKDSKSNRDKLQTAKAIRAQRETELFSSGHGLVAIHHRKTSFLTFFAKLAETKSEGTKVTWENTLKHIRTYAGKDVDVLFHDVTPEWLEGFREYLLKKANLSNNSAFSIFGILKTALRRAVKSGKIAANPMEKVDGIKRLETQRAYLTIEELNKLAATACPHAEVGRAFLFACFAGLRLSDVERLQGKHIRGKRIEFSQKKTRTAEYFDLSEQALAYLGAPVGEDENVFALPNRDAIGTALERWSKTAKLPKHVTFHTARHTFATLLLTYGADIYTVSKLLGHKSIQTTLIYAKIIDEKRRQAVSLLPSLNTTVPIVAAP